MNLFITSSSFCLKSSGFSIYSIMPSAYNDNFTSSLPTCCGYDFSTMWSRRGKSGHPCLGPELNRNVFSFSQLCIILTVGMSYIAFIMLRYVHSILTLLRVFIKNGCWILSNTFSVSIKMIMGFLPLLCCVISHWFCIYWTTLLNLGWIPLSWGVWSFLCIVGFSLLIFSWEFLHTYSSKILI